MRDFSGLFVCYFLLLYKDVKVLRIFIYPPNKLLLSLTNVNLMPSVLR